MNLPVRPATASSRLTIVDCDIHPAFRAPADLHPFLPARWRDHMTTFGEHLRQGLSGQLAYPRMTAAGMRVGARVHPVEPAGFDDTARHLSRLTGKTPFMLKKLQEDAKAQPCRSIFVADPLLLLSKWA